ncbi:MAG TPA: CoA-transferase subunit beta [Terriglobales bacterium]|nr:CoA-transferase subunit beta [Terriglobales bacterium]
MHEVRYTPDELMTIAAARRLKNGAVCFVGIGIPSAAANLARVTHAPDVVLVYESGTIGAKPNVLPLSIGDGELAQTADTVVSIPEIFRYWLQGGRIDVGFLGAAQIDKYANLNSTVIGPYDAPKVRLPGAGGAPEIASGARELCVVMSQTSRAFVSKIDFVTSSGLAFEGSENAGRKYRPRTVITDLGILENDPQTGELWLTGIHPGITVDRVCAATGWDLQVRGTLTITPEPTSSELSALRDLKQRTAIAHRSSSQEVT